MVKKQSLIIVPLFASLPAGACTTCNRQLQEAIAESRFYPNLLTMLTAFFVLAIVLVILTILSTRWHVTRQRMSPSAQLLTPVPLGTAALVLGIGIGGFIDGIVLHQLLQWHEMLSAQIPPDTLLAKSVNMFWDGVFHMFTLLTCILGIYLLWRALRRRDTNHSGRLLAGGMLAGWGLFNLVEGVIDHQILGLHNVREISGSQDAWNYGFLLLAILQLLAGWLMMRRAGKASAPRS